MISKRLAAILLILGPIITVIAAFTGPLGPEIDWGDSQAVLGGLASNTSLFHSIDGSGYDFMAEQLILEDKRNPITASRLVKVFSRWRSYNTRRQKLMLKAIETISCNKLSSNTREVIELIKG